MNNWKTFVKFAWWTAFLMLLILFWDRFILKVDTLSLTYILVKGAIILSLIFLGGLVRHTKKVTWHQEAYALIFYSYCFYGMAFLDMTYSFSFVEAFFLLSLVMRTTVPRFLAVNAVGLLGLVAGHYYAREPVFVALGQSYKPHSFIANFMLFLIALLIHFIFTRQQNKIHELNEKFALIGKQSSFLMHEIKTPLNRVVANSEETMSEEIMSGIRRDTQKIQALVSSVETLIQDPKLIAKTFENFNLKELAENLHADFDTYLNSMNIEFSCDDLAGTFTGNKPLLYQLLRNMIVNAIEAIGYRGDVRSEIRITLAALNGFVLITISNTNSSIPQKDLEKIFEPYYSTKKKGQNKGLGLALVKSIVEAHQGKIQALSSSEGTTFKVSLPSVST